MCLKESAKIEEGWAKKKKDRTKYTKPECSLWKG